MDKYLNDTVFPSVLSESDKNLCEGLITEKECTIALKHFKDGKSPGHDGLPPEFYKAFWPVFKETLLSSYNDSFAMGKLCFSGT